MSDAIANIRGDLKKLHSRVETNTALLILFLVGLVFYILIQLNLPSRSTQSHRGHTESWGAVRDAWDNHDYDKANEIAKRLTDRNPTYHYGYAYLGTWSEIALSKPKIILLALTSYFQLPNEQRLEAVRKRIAAEHLR